MPNDLWIELFENLEIRFQSFNPIKSMESYEKAVGNSKKKSQLWYRLGIVYEESEKYKKAKESFEKAVVIDSENTNACYHLKIVKEKNNP